MDTASKLVTPAPSAGGASVFFSGSLRVKRAKQIRTARVCLLTDASIQVDETIHPLCDLTLGHATPEGFSLRSGNKDVFKFYTDSEVDCEMWIREIESLVAGTNRKLLEVLLVERLGIDRATGQEDFVGSIFLSMCPSFVILLLNEHVVDPRAIKLVIRLFQARHRLEFLLRTILLAEIVTVPPHSIFACGSRFSVAYLSLFVVVAQDWLISLARNVVQNEVTTAEEFFELLFLGFAHISGLPLLFTRSLCLALALAEFGDSNPLIPFFEFLFSALTLVVEQFFERELPRVTRIRGDVRSILSRPDQLQSPSVRLLAPFCHSILRRVPELDAVTFARGDAEDLYQFLVENTGPVLKLLGMLPSGEPTGNPLVFSYFQNLAFLKKYPPP
jgi:hypothetical protein